MKKDRHISLTMPVIISIFCLLGAVFLIGARATTQSTSSEAETGTITNAQTIADSTASGNGAVKFTGSSQQASTPLCQGMSNWSAPSTWGSAGVPVADASVTLPANSSIKVDVDVPHLSRVTVPAGTTLCFPDRATTFSAKQILVLGTLQAGTPTNRLTSNVTIKLEGGTATDTDTYTVTGPAADAITQYNTTNANRCAPAPMGCIHVGTNIGTNVLSAFNGGTINIYGRDSGLTWTDLASTSNAGSSTLSLRDAVTWQPGDQIVVASSDFDWNHQERKTVQSVSADGKTVILTSPLTYKHSGISTCQTLNGETRCVDERAEVGLLSHNIKIAGPDDAAANNGFGGQMIILTGGHVGMDGVEMYHLGQKGKMARYPLHFHIMGDDGKNINVSNISSHDNYNRFVDFHGTNYAHLSGLVADNTIGHGIMFEDGTEHDNTLTHNLVGGIQYNPNVSERLRLSDEAPTAFWITNQDNNFIGNHAFGSDGSGFWVDFLDNASKWENINSLWPGTFNDNSSHSNMGISGLTSLSPDEQGKGFYIGGYGGSHDQPGIAYRNSAWKNSNMGFWIDGAVTLTDSTAANNKPVAVTIQDSYMTGGMMTYLTANTEPSTTTDPSTYPWGILRQYHGAADYDNIWVAGYGGTTDTQYMGALTNGGAGISNFPSRIKNIKFFGTGYKVEYNFCMVQNGTQTVYEDCYWGPQHAGNGHVLYDMDGSIRGDGVPIAVTNAEPFLQYGSTLLYPNAPDPYYPGMHSARGMVVPFNYKFMWYQPNPDEQSSSIIRDSDGMASDLGGWLMVRTGDRYYINNSTPQDGFEFHGMYSGSTDFYMNVATKPTYVYRCVYNMEYGGCGTAGNEGVTRFTQPEASSMANLGVDGDWWYENGKLYLRITGTGDIPFGLKNSTLYYGDKFGTGDWWQVVE